MKKSTMLLLVSFTLLRAPAAQAFHPHINLNAGVHHHSTIFGFPVNNSINSTVNLLDARKYHWQQLAGFGVFALSGLAFIHARRARNYTQGQKDGLSALSICGILAGLYMAIEAPEQRPPA